MTRVKEEKKNKKVKISRYNPSARRHEIIEVEEVQVGVLKYQDVGDSFECLVGIETEPVEGDMYSGKKVTFKKARRISSIQWDTSRSAAVGERIRLCPRDVAIMDAILTYLKRMGYYIP